MLAFVFFMVGAIFIAGAVGTIYGSVYGAMTFGILLMIAALLVYLNPYRSRGGYQPTGSGERPNNPPNMGSGGKYPRMRETTEP